MKEFLIKTNEKIRVYGHVFARTDEELVRKCKEKILQGFTAMGHRSSFLDELISVPYDKTHVKNVEESIRRVNQLSYSKS